MTKKILSTIIAIIFAGVSFAQTDAAAKKLLNEVSKKYSSYKTIQSDFTLNIQDANQKSYVQKGIMYFNKPKKQYAIKMKDQEIFSDGKSVWNVAADVKEIQVSPADHNDNTIGPTNLFSFYQKGYTYVTMQDESYKKDGKTEKLRVVELSPIDKSTNYFKIKIRINKNNHIHDVTVFDKSSNRFTYTIQTLYIGKNLPSTLFTLDKTKYKGYEIVDLT